MRDDIDEALLQRYCRTQEAQVQRERRRTRRGETSLARIGQEFFWQWGLPSSSWPVDPEITVVVFLPKAIDGIHYIIDDSSSGVGVPCTILPCFSFENMVSL